jgi:hypothetical protein
MIIVITEIKKFPSLKQSYQEVSITKTRASRARLEHWLPHCTNGLHLLLIVLANITYQCFLQKHCASIPVEAPLVSFIWLGMPLMI